MAMSELQSVAQELRVFAVRHPWDLAEAVRTTQPPPAGCRREITLGGRGLRVQFTFSRSLPGGATRRPLWQLSISPQDGLGPLPPDTVDQVRRAFFPKERPIEIPSPLFPGLVRQFSLFGSPLIQPDRHDGQDGD